MCKEKQDVINKISDLSSISGYEVQFVIGFTWNQFIEKVFSYTLPLLIIFVILLLLTFLPLSV